LRSLDLVNGACACTTAICRVKSFAGINNSRIELCICHTPFSDHSLWYKFCF